MKFKDFYKLIDCCQKVFIQCYYEDEPTKEVFEGMISDAPIYMGEYKLYCGEDGEAIFIMSKDNEVIMYIDLQSKKED